MISTVAAHQNLHVAHIGKVCAVLQNDLMLLPETYLACARLISTAGALLLSIARHHRAVCVNICVVTVFIDRA